MLPLRQTVLNAYRICMFKKTAALFFLLCFLGGVGKGWHWAKDGFNIQRVRSAFPPLKKETIPGNIAAALDQSYSYLAQGRQYYAFESSDGKYVLKLPRLDRYEVPFWLQACPFPFLSNYRDQVRAVRHSRLENLMESARIAWEELSGQTAVLYVHFNETEGLARDTQIADRIGRSFRIELNRTPFVLQEKKNLMAPAFADSLKEGNEELSKAILESFLKIIAFRSEKGIFNKEYSYFKNYGFDGNEAVEIDVGTFYRKKQISKTSLQETVEHISPWLEKIDPDLQKWFLSKANELQNRTCVY